MNRETINKIVELLKKRNDTDKILEWGQVREVNVKLISKEKPTGFSDSFSSDSIVIDYMIFKPAISIYRDRITEELKQLGYEED